MSEVIHYILIGISLLCWFLIILKLIQNKFSPVKTVKAEVVDKYKPNVASKYPERWKPKSCVVVFKTKDKKLSFVVSEFSYGNYKISKKGTLKYKGNKIISFK
ncbi:MAG: DUF2500 family protein [Clostridia bacterium]|nr:DUF2500 family protein [Clostridia bacterium]